MNNNNNNIEYPSYVIPPVDKDLIKSELKNKNFLRKTNFGDKEIYITTAHLSPNIMQEIGRLREISFLAEGGGTGNATDIDIFDTLPEPYCMKQIFVWSPEDEEIVGGYRFIHGSNAMQKADGSIFTPSATEFHFSEEFINNYLPYTVELGRAFVQPMFQPTNDFRKGMYSLDNLWDGLGSIALELPETRYFFGKITMYPQMNRKAKNLILYFYKKHFPDPEGLMWPLDPLYIDDDFNYLNKLFNGRNYKEDYQILVRAVRELGSAVPPLISTYMKLTDTMRCFGTSMNHEFGNADETGIMINLNDLHPDKRARYLESYEEKNRKFDRRKLFKIDLKRLPWWRSSSPEEEAELMQLKALKEETKKLKAQTKELKAKIKQKQK